MSREDIPVLIAFILTCILYAVVSLNVQEAIDSHKSDVSVGDAE